MNVKERIVQTALLYFKEYGIKQMNMDLLAGKMHISKKTIYLNFRTKDELVMVCMESELKNIGETMEDNLRKSESVLDAIISVSSDLCRTFSSYCVAFQQDLKHYLQAFQLMEHFKESLHNRFANLFCRGVREGIFCPELNYSLIISLLAVQIEHINIEFQPAMLLTFLRGISTDKGLDELKVYRSVLNQQYADKNS